VATCDIKPNQEVLVSYGKRYVFHQNLEICWWIYVFLSEKSIQFYNLFIKFLWIRHKI
jgi:hypothetical protein